MMIDKYLKWIKDNTVETKQDNGWTEVATPFMDRHNDGLIIYVKEDADNITISDDGYIIGDMEMSGLDVNKRMKTIENFMRGYGVHVSDNKELQVKATLQNYPVKQHLLLQAMMSASDMFVPSKQNDNTIFLDDITAFFKANNIFYIPDTQFQGKSGYIHKVDFVIPGGSKFPERFVYALNSPKINTVKSSIFMWSDIQQNRPVENKMVAILNDNRKIANGALEAFINYDAIPICWSKRNSSIDSLRIA